MRSTCSSLPPSPQPLGTTDLFMVSIVLLFPEYHVVGIIQCVSFSDWLLSLSKMHLSFPHVFQWLDSPFLSFFFFNLFLFIYFWLCWVFVSVRGLSLVAASGGHPSSRCAGLSLSWPLVAEHRFQMRRLSSCGSRA